MAKNSKELTIVSISLPKRINSDIDHALAELGYMSRSELIRDAVREFLREKKKLEEVRGTVEGVITLLYNHDVASKVSEVRHHFKGIFRSFMHSDFDIDNCSCCEVLLFSGDAGTVRKAYYELKAIKGVDETHLYVASR
ncbi:MAG TPA: CopG family ribbon-helix-helix protein [Candidatus Thermoplasmatota archaeon]|nr:CopG family ribbon-helix-helix protein [Candidatus Thermoplasmatota archaeon]